MGCGAMIVGGMGMSVWHLRITGFSLRQCGWRFPFYAVVFSVLQLCVFVGGCSCAAMQGGQVRIAG